MEIQVFNIICFLFYANVSFSRVEKCTELQNIIPIVICIFMSFEEEVRKDNKRLTLRRPLRKKLRMRWFFRCFQGEEVESFFKSDLTDPLIFWKIPIQAHQDFIFQWILYKDHILSQMVLQLIRKNEIKEKNNDVYSH